MFTSLMRVAALTIAAAMLSACVAGQSIDLRYQPSADDLKGMSAAAAETGGGTTVAVQVIEHREYVNNKEKNPSYIGHYRAGFGNTWAVTTKGDRPLAEVMTDDLTAEMSSLGFKVTAPEQALARLEVFIHEWNFDTFMNGRFWYLLDVAAKKSDGSVLAQKSMDDNFVIKGNIVTGARFAFEEELPKIYNKILRQIVREDPDILQKLRSMGSPGAANRPK